MKVRILLARRNLDAMIQKLRLNLTPKPRVHRLKSAKEPGNIVILRKSRQRLNWLEKVGVIGEIKVS